MSSDKSLHTIAKVSEWPMDASKPFIVAGPCSAETSEQVMETAKALGETGVVSLLRAGIWKPRTRPGSFQGIGEPALEWLIQAGKECGIPTTTEVANAQHVEACLKAGVDVLWIGARTTVNPFSVQEIADALKGVDIPVIIKNPINPDLQLWIGAIERFLMNGSNKLMAMHRGFAITNTGQYRNAPMWEIPIALKAHYPDLPILSDPSHIGGKRELLHDLAQKALDLGMHGIMLETHPTPDEAWSDAAQQVTPDGFKQIIDQLSFRSTDVDSEEITNQLALLREQIDNIDSHILQQLRQRMAVVEKIGEYKKDNEITILQLERWKEILETRGAQGAILGLDPQLVQRLLELIHNASITRQGEIMNKDDENIMW